MKELNFLLEKNSFVNIVLNSNDYHRCWVKKIL